MNIKHFKREQQKKKIVNFFYNYGDYMSGIVSLSLLGIVIWSLLVMTH